MLTVQSRQAYNKLQCAHRSQLHTRRQGLHHARTLVKIALLPGLGQVGSHSIASKATPSDQECLYSSLRQYSLMQNCSVAYLAQEQDVGGVISLLCPEEVRHTQHAPASHIQQTVPSPHLPQGPLPIGCEVVGAIHLYCYLLTCNMQHHNRCETIPITTCDNSTQNLRHSNEQLHCQNSTASR